MRAFALFAVGAAAVVALTACEVKVRDYSQAAGVGGSGGDATSTTTGGLVPGVCGDGVLNEGEACDATDFGSDTCVAHGFVGGALTCLANCLVDDTLCSLTCGNGVLDAGEVCDGTIFGNDATCQTFLPASPGGSLICSASCTMIDASMCIAPESCGNGTYQMGEQCDGEAFNGVTCSTLGFASGTLDCNANCTLNTAGCTTCGNDIVQAGEQCDGTDLNGSSCQTQGFAPGGSLTCAGNCTFDYSGCSNCGNGVVNSGETCDGANLNGNSCNSLGYYAGNLGCDNCQLNATNCTNCGNGNIDANEQCDNANVGGQSCMSLGLGQGPLGCNGNCTFNTTACDASYCGNGAVETNEGEQCDGGNTNGANCGSLGYSGGNLGCYGNCQFDASGCYSCGDGNVNPGEQCDGGNLNGQSCQSLGYYTGSLSCSGCGFNTSLCSNCGNGVINAGEECDGGDFGGICTDCGCYYGDYSWYGNIDCTGSCTISAGNCYYYPCNPYCW